MTQIFQKKIFQVHSTYERSLHCLIQLHCLGISEKYCLQSLGKSLYLMGQDPYLRQFIGMDKSASYIKLTGREAFLDAYPEGDTIRRKDRIAAYAKLQVSYGIYGGPLGRQRSRAPLNFTLHKWLICVTANVISSPSTCDQNKDELRKRALLFLRKKWRPEFVDFALDSPPCKKVHTCQAY